MSGDLNKPFEWAPFARCPRSPCAECDEANIPALNLRHATAAASALERARAEIDRDIARAKAGSSDEIFGLATARETITRLLESRP